MKQILIALLLAFTTSTVINAQKQSSIEKDSTENVKVTLSKKTDTKADESNTTVTVIERCRYNGHGYDGGQGRKQCQLLRKQPRKSWFYLRIGRQRPSLRQSQRHDQWRDPVLYYRNRRRLRTARIYLVCNLFLPLQEPESPLPPCRTGHCSRTTAAGKLYPRKPAGRPTLTRHQKHLYRDRTFHLPLGDHRRVRNRSNRTAYHVYGHRPMDNRQQTTENR